MSFERFRVEDLGDGVGLITMCRPDKLNAMDTVWFDELVTLTEELGRSTTLRAVVLTGEGRAFSAGGDIDMFADLDGDVGRVRPHLRRVYEAFHSVERCAIPVIAAVNGIAYGGGLELALACDVVVAGSSARFSFKEVTVGLMPGYGVIRAPEVIGRHWTRCLALTGRTVGPEVLERAGLVVETVPDEDLLERALATAREIAAHSSLGVRVAKAYINRDTESGYAESVEATALLFGTPEHREAVTAFRLRRE
ncbi:enoyl-CoA hydratase/isomerase family protein [Gordonia hydrophobica]|uniref:Enoyl-CoA hydratase/isomerase family protein n=1 Tax=Gordonia hydrophobica TaxID=40516 RepID=A0ABZ2TX62_9ACTN|nr:enoyl-CoA hydratase/isomerase family protein [Gordonia hydrophobica]MBM7365853.1 enoyl-CoA hydratase/carnithine racemase [Gordonia hydrophobica]